MTIVHIVMFKFRSDVSIADKERCVHEMRSLKTLPSVLDGRLVLGGPSITTPIERSKGFEYCLVSYHKDRTALEEYQTSSEHVRVASTYLFPFKDDLCRFDFEVEKEDEHMFQFGILGPMQVALGTIGADGESADASGKSFQ